MKPFLFFRHALSVAFGLLSVTALAQPIQNNHSNTGNRHAQGTPLSQKSAAKTTTDNASRLIAFTALHYDGSAFVQTDSYTYAYPGGRRQADNGTSYNLYNPSTSTYTNSSKFTQIFDIHNNITTNSNQDWIPYLSAWRNSNQTVYTYDAMNNMLTRTYQNWDTVANAWVNSGKDTYTYNTSNQMVSSLGQSWNTGTSSWDNSGRGTYTYDASGNNISTLGESWNASLGTWDSSSRTTMTYDGSGNMLTELGQGWYGSWNNGYQRAMTYDGSNDMLTETEQYWSSGSWTNSGQTLYSDYINHQPQTVTSQYWETAISAYVTSYKGTYTYNSYTQPTYYEEIRWNPATSSWYYNTGCFADRYYYETYVSGVNNTTAIQGKAEIFPVPAKDEIHINVTWNESQEFTVTIADMACRVCNTWNVPPCIQYSAVVPVENLPSGNYIITLSGAKGAVTQQISIVK